MNNEKIENELNELIYGYLAALETVVVGSDKERQILSSLEKLYGFKAISNSKKN